MQSYGNNPIHLLRTNSLQPLPPYLSEERRAQAAPFAPGSKSPCQWSILGERRGTTAYSGRADAWNHHSARARSSRSIRRR